MSAKPIKPTNQTPKPGATEIHASPIKMNKQQQQQSPNKNTFDIDMDLEDSAELDENIVNLDVTINQSKEENRAKFKDPKFMDTSVV